MSNVHCHPLTLIRRLALRFHLLAIEFHCPIVTEPEKEPAKRGADTNPAPARGLRVLKARNPDSRILIAERNGSSL
jgi:hypothetical protein